MALIAKSAGWEDDPETGARIFAVRLVADREEDVPPITFDDVWNETPLKLERVK